MQYLAVLRGAAIVAMLAFGTSAAAQPPAGEKPVGTTGASGETKTATKETPDEQRVEPIRQPSGFVAKSRAWGEKQYERFNRVMRPLTENGFKPEIGTLGQGSGLAAGLRWRVESLGNSPIGIETFAGYSYHGYELYELRLGMVRDRKERTTLQTPDAHIASHFDAFKARVPGLGLYGHLQYRHSPQHRFWGLGPDSREEDGTSFLMRGAAYEMVAEYQRSTFFGVAARGGILDIEVGPGGDTDRPSTQAVFDDATAPGLRRQPAFAHLAGAMTFDTRDAPGVPRTGGSLGILASRFHALNVGPENLSFFRTAVDGRYFVPATSRSVIALRALASRDFADSGGRVPFYLQQTLGGGDVLRGFDRGRFRGNSLVTLSAEYRYDVHKFVELAAFGDTGQVAESFSDLSTSRFETSWGVGVRAKHKGNVFFRTDVAFSREGHRLIFSAGQVF